MSTVFVSEKSFRRRTGYAGDWDRIEPYNRVALDLDIVPFIGEKNADHFQALIDSGDWNNIREQQLVDGYLIDMTAQFMAWRAATVLFRHFNNAGAVTPVSNPATEIGVKLLKDYYLNAAQALQSQLEKFYCRYSAQLNLPQPIGGTVDHAPFAGLGLNVDLNVNKIEQELVIVPPIDFEKIFYWGTIPIGETLTIEDILLGNQLAPGDSVSFNPINGETDHVWIAVEEDKYSTWGVNSDAINTSSLNAPDGLFNKFTINEYVVHRQNYISQIDPFILTIS